MNKRKILVVDDDASLLRVMKHHLSEAGYEVIACSDGQEGVEAQKKEKAALIFTDIKMPTMGGMEFIRAIREFDDGVVIIVITGFPTIGNAVEAMKAGAYDFIQKPVEKSHLLAIADKAFDHFHLQDENQRLRSLVADHLDFGVMIGKSPIMQQLYNQARKASQTNATILLFGETGTGKEMLAKAIHQNSRRRNSRFVPVNCAAIPSSLLESELFGHVKGAFTGAFSDRKGLIEEANGGTFFMDEIGDLPMDIQPKVLRVLQEKEIQVVGTNTGKKVDIRFIAATHRDLASMVENGHFREDLYYRLNVVPITIPPVHQRKEDIIPLFMHFLKEFAQEESRKIPNLEKAVIDRLETYSWPGNVREIQNMALRLMTMHSGEVITENDLPDILHVGTLKTDSLFKLPEHEFDLESWIDDVVIKALEKNGWNQSKTAKYLNISRNTLVYRLEKRPKLRAIRHNSTP